MTYAWFVVLALAVAAVIAATWYRAAWRRAVALADRDPLTGLLNRRGFDAAAASELARAARFGRPLTLAYIDLDDFKRINDTHGHAAGDRLLAAVGRALAAGRASDVVARLGGDEFALLLPETDAVAAASAVERVREAAAAAGGAVGLAVTLSCGVLTFAEPPRSLAAALAEVDRVLYARKRARRARTPDCDPLATTLRMAAGSGRVGAATGQVYAA